MPGDVGREALASRLERLHELRVAACQELDVVQTLVFAPLELPLGAVLTVGDHLVEEVTELPVVAELHHDGAQHVRELAVQLLEGRDTARERTREANLGTRRTEGRGDAERLLEPPGLPGSLHPEHALTRIDPTEVVLHQAVRDRVQGDGVEDRVRRVADAHFGGALAGLDPRVDVLRTVDAPIVVPQLTQVRDVVGQRVPTEQAAGRERREAEVALAHHPIVGMVAAAARCEQQRQRLFDAEPRLEVPVVERTHVLMMRLEPHTQTTDPDPRKNPLEMAVPRRVGHDVATREARVPAARVGDTHGGCAELTSGMQQLAVHHDHATTRIGRRLPVVAELEHRVTFGHVVTHVVDDARIPTRSHDLVVNGVVTMHQCAVLAGPVHLDLRRRPRSAPVDPGVEHRFDVRPCLWTCLLSTHFYPGCCHVLLQLLPMLSPRSDRAG